MNVISVKGGKVHSETPGAPEGRSFPLCRTGDMSNAGTHYRPTDAPLSCKTCLTYEERREQAAQKEEIMTKSDETTTPEADQHAATVEQVRANIERASSLVEAENTEGLAELAKETETLISELPTRGRFEAPDAAPVTFAALKKDLRANWRAAAEAKPTPAAAPAPAPKAEVARVAEYTDFQGVPELVDMGAAKVADAIRLHIKTSVTAKEIASVILDMWRRIPNKDGNPDIAGASDAAKKASSALYKAAGEALGGEDGYEVEQSVKKLIRAVQTQRTDVRAAYLRSLDDDTEDAAEERAHFAGLLADKPEDVPASEFLATYYGVGLKGEVEKARERFQAKRELEASGERRPSNGGSGDDSDDSDDSDEPTDPDAEIRAVARRLRADIAKAKVDSFQSASDEAKVEVREQLVALNQAIKDMITATL